jgi:hypothetical protein
MKVELDEDELEAIIKAIEHYDAYLVSQRREDSQYLGLLKKLRNLQSPERPSKPLGRR